MTVPRKTRGKSAKSLRLIMASHETLAEIQPATVRAVCYRLFYDGTHPRDVQVEHQRSQQAIGLCARDRNVSTTLRHQLRGV
jgi:hypothetical protein